MLPQDLFPDAATDQSEIAKMEAWLAREQADLAEYQANKGKPGYFYGRGFSSSSKRIIARIKQWLKLVGDNDATTWTTQK